MAAPFSSIRPAWGSFIETEKGAGPSEGQVRSLTSAVSSVIAIVVIGLTASSLNVAVPLRSANCSTFSLSWGGAGSVAAAGVVGLASLATGAGPPASGRWPRATRSIFSWASLTARSDRPSTSIAPIVNERATRSASLILTLSPGTVRNGSVRPVWTTSSPLSATPPRTVPRLRPVGASSIASASTAFTRPARGAAGALARYGRRGARSKPSTVTRVAVARGSSASESLVAAIAAPFSLSLASRLPGRAGPPSVRLRASSVMSSIRHSLSGEVVWSRRITARRCSDIRPRSTVHLADEDCAGASTLPPLRRSRNS